MEGVIVGYLDDYLDENRNFLKEWYDWADRIFIIGNYSDMIDKKISIKHKLGLTEEMVKWLDVRYSADDFDWEYDYKQVFAQWYISEKFTDIENFLTWFSIRRFQNILVLTEDCPYEEYSIRSIIGGILRGTSLDKYFQYTYFYNEPVDRSTYYYYKDLYKGLEKEVYPSYLYTEKGFKIRIYPNKKQEKYLNLNINGCSYIWNKILGDRINQENDCKSQNISCNKFDSYKEMVNITSIKQEECNNWLNNCDSRALQETIANLGKAYDRYYKGIAGHPKFKSRKNQKRSFTCVAIGKIDSNIYFTNSGKTRLKIPKLNEPLKCRHRKNLVTGDYGKISRVTVTEECGKWYASVLYVDVPVRRECKIHKPNEIQTREKYAVGIDLGITTFATLADNLGDIQEIPNPKYYNRASKQLTKLQRILDNKKQKVIGNGKEVHSKNYLKTLNKIKRLHKRTFNKRREMQHMWSKYITDNYQYIFLETLNTKELMNSREKYLRTKKSYHTRNKNLHDVAFYEFTRQLDYKATWKGKSVGRVDKYFASTRICTYCETPYPYKLQSYIKQWRCLNIDCPTNKVSPYMMIKRDKNAAINILREGLFEYKIDLDSYYPAFNHYIKADKAIETDNNSNTIEGKNYTIDNLTNKAEDLISRIMDNKSSAITFGK